ncbi:zf-TFIIB domain-containing protein [Chelativorans sp. AA-79]|uniref:TFIIB-type zinc ribbon-containing protein n=1 Tax=Chelativorans sp. AA-79 TaxID=3028735 RepID=UPI0023F69D99|nr:zf-TFIIB domain-containing protein [Chelativorans sp. AA-79]WEX07193.1 zf-TFIIB domain-containing protein [Chelativorans sp. AA-79]
MQCPVDGSELVMSERQGIEIDYCPKCRGVWLDRGELDKIVERTSQEGLSAQFDQRSRERDERGYRDDRNYGSQRPHKKKKSLLGEIFDF